MAIPLDRVYAMLASHYAEEQETHMWTVKSPLSSGSLASRWKARDDYIMRIHN